jgi:hypothetical protein
MLSTQQAVAGGQYKQRQSSSAPLPNLVDD